MFKLTRGGMVLPLLILLVTGMFATGLKAQDDEVPFKPNGSK